jgi:hypothetical protein
MGRDIAAGPGAVLPVAEILVNHVCMVDGSATRSTVQVARAWVAAVSTQDVPTVMAHSTRDIALGGPRGTARGQPALRDWVERTGLQMTVERVFAAGTCVVLLHQAVWRDRNGLAIAEATIANRFEVTGDRISAVTRYDGLTEALADAGLTEADEQTAAAGS